MIVDFRASSSYTFMDALDPDFSDARLARTKSDDPVFAPVASKLSSPVIARPRSRCPRESSPATRPTDRPNLLHGKPVGVLGIEGALRSRVLKRAQAEVDGECALAHLYIALAERAWCPADVRDGPAPHRASG
jgi:hypothetical protein